jgi:hypothetical protein
MQAMKAHVSRDDCLRLDAAPSTEQLTDYQTRLAQAHQRLAAGESEAQAQALALLKDYRLWMRTLPEASAVTAQATLDAAVEALKDALSRQCRL